MLDISLALIAAPLALGALVGLLLRRLRGGRAGGVGWAVTCVATSLLVVPLYRRFPLVGLWDAGFETILFAAGILLSAHSLFASWRNVLISMVSTVLSLLLLELACRLFLPSAPMFANAGGAHLLLSDVLRANPGMHPADTQSKEIVCSVVYGDEYPGLLSLPPDTSLVLPRTYVPRAGATRRVLHIGDSMVFGLGVARAETFTADLERLEPGVEHINGGIPGTAPDAYLAVLKAWLDAHPVDEVVMYPFEGNDIRDVDGPFPWCDWQSLLEYDQESVSLRCRKATVPDLSHSTWTWLRYNSPPPYPIRALIGQSVAAAYFGAIMVDTGFRASLILEQSDDTRFAHIEAIFRAANNELQARRIPFIVVALPMRNRIDSQVRGPGQTHALVEAARRAGVPALDASEPFFDATAAGEHPFLGSPQQPDIHFNADGHALLARWLHEHLGAAAVPPAPQ